MFGYNEKKRKFEDGDKVSILDPVYNQFEGTVAGYDSKTKLYRVTLSDLEWEKEFLEKDLKGVNDVNKAN